MKRLATGKQSALKVIIVTWLCPFQGHFIILRLGLSMITCTPNLKSLCSPTMKIWKAMQNVEFGVVWGLRVTQDHH